MMDYKEISCVNCGQKYIPKVHNSCYCGPVCRKSATNKKVLAKYYENKARKQKGLKRLCGNSNCDTILSMYNRELICEQCKDKRLDKRMLRWGYSQETLNQYHDI
jgi:hypothetical protein